jgi:hypothetical protein
LFGTLYLAGRYEETPWGLAAGDQAKYTTLSDNLITPLREIVRILRAKPGPVGTTANADGEDNGAS